MQGATRIGWQGEVLTLQRKEILLHGLSYAGVLLCMAGVVTSPALLSIGIIVIMLAGLASTPLREQWRRFVQHKPAVFMSLLFALQLLSGLWTRESGLDHWLEELKIKVPLFLGMYGLAVMGPFSTQKVRIAWAVLLLGTFFIGTGTVIDYVLHADEINERIKVSKEVQVWLGCNHIYFSIVMAFAILANLWSIAQPGKLLFRGDKYVLGAMTLACFVEMHVLTTRTGLVGLYLTLMILGWVLLLRRRKYLLAIVLVVGLLSVPVAGYYGLESFKHRVDNTVMDLTEYFKGHDPNYLSIGTRLESWKTAIHLWKKHPLTGVAMADLKADMTDQYVEDKTLLCPENFQLPHNQFIQNLAGWGLLGLATICLAWFYPVLSRRWPKDLIFWIFWLNYSLAMMGESTMERQVGICFLVPCFMLSLGVGVMAKHAPAPSGAISRMD
jgi:O-antigen ligase